MQICVQQANTQLTVVGVSICNNNAACVSLLHDPQVCTIIIMSLSVRLSYRPLAVGENAHNSWTTLERNSLLIDACWTSVRPVVAKYCKCS